jgi:hypothetical protein
MISKNKFIFIFSFLLAITIYFSGCILFAPSDAYKYNTQDENKIIEVINNYENKLANCDDNDPCTTEYLDKNQNCKYNYDAKCIETRDNNILKNDFDTKILNCNNELKINSTINNCNQTNANEKLECIKNLSQKIDYLDCCYLIANKFEDLKNTETKLLLNKCQIDLVINKNESDNCMQTNNPKECFLCYLKNTGSNPYTSNLCSSFTEDNKQFCNSSILVNYEYCDSIKDEKLKKKCLTTEVNQNNCIYYTTKNMPINITKDSDYKTNAFEVYDNTRTKLDFVKRTELDVNNFWKYNKITQKYTFAFDDTVGQSYTLDDCKVNINSPKTDYSKKRYSTFYFDYKEYHFVYTIPVYDDLYLYSKDLKYQYCYKYNNNEYYKRYLMDPLNNAILDKISEDFNSLKKYGFIDNEIFEIATKFVQEIPYNYNWEKRNVYPYEVFYTMRGVCLDKVVILAQILKNLGYETYIASGIVDYTGSTTLHAVLAVPCSDSDYIYDNKKMCFIETTHPYLIGEKEINNKLDFLNLSKGKPYTEDSYGPTKAKELKDNETKMTEKMNDIDTASKLKDWVLYNKYVLEYNEYLYNTFKIRFKNFK